MIVTSCSQARNVTDDGATRQDGARDWKTIECSCPCSSGILAELAVTVRAPPGSVPQEICRLEALRLGPVPSSKCA
jgi:hypothetical protein